MREVKVPPTDIRTQKEEQTIPESPDDHSQHLSKTLYRSGRLASCRMFPSSVKCFGGSRWERAPQSTSRGLQWSQALHSGRDKVESTSPSVYAGPGELWWLMEGLCDLMPEKSLF